MLGYQGPEPQDVEEGDAGRGGSLRRSVLPEQHEVGQGQEGAAGRRRTEPLKSGLRPPGIGDRHLPGALERMTASQEIDDLLARHRPEIALLEDRLDHGASTRVALLEQVDERQRELPLPQVRGDRLAEDALADRKSTRL